MSVVSATEPQFYQQQNGGSQGTSISKPNELTWKQTEIDGSQYYTFQFSGNVDPSFKLFVMAGSSKWNSGGFNGEGQLDIVTNSMLVSTQGLAMGDQGTGTLTWDMWTGDATTKSFIMDLSGVSAGYAFYGNMVITGSGGTASNYSSVSITGKFGGKGIKGNVTFNSLGKSNLIFSDGAGIEGNITVSNGTNNTISDLTNLTGGIVVNNNPTLNFTNSNANSNTLTISGNITANSRASGILNFNYSTTIAGVIEKPEFGSYKHGATTIFNFKGETNTLGGINIAGTTHYGQNINQIIFETTTKNNVIKGNIIAIGGSYGSNTTHQNKITFKNAGTNLISGNLEARDDAFASRGENIITFEKGGTINNTQILAEGGTNTITFQGTQDASLTSTNILVRGSTWGLPGTNIITFSNSGAASITSNISATGGTNSITFSSSTSNTLGGASSTIIANGGTNNLTATKALTLNSSIYAGGSGTSGNGGDGGNGGTNRFLLSENVELGNNLIIRAGNRTNQNTEKKNIIKFGSTLTNGKTISEVTAVTGNSNLGRTANILSFDGLGASANLSIGYINNSEVVGSYATGYNYIGKELTTGSTANDLALGTSFTDSAWASSGYQASNLNLTITNDIYAKYGKNYINVGSLSVSGKIDGNAGTNNIAVNTLSAGTIKARWNGRNNIIITAAASQVPGSRTASSSTFSGLIMAGGDGNGSGSNYIYFDDTSVATFESTSSLSAYNGANYISFGNSATANNIAIASISASNTGTNYLAKNILSNSNGKLSVSGTSTQDWWASDTYAFTGALSITKGVSNNGSGANYISYKASTNANSTIISNISEDNGSKTFNTAISGSNTIYLNVKDSNISSGVDAIQTYLSSLAGSQASAYTTLAEKAVIAGDIVGSGSTNIKIVGKANVSASAGIASKTITNNNQIAILGNITTSSGATTNIVMQDAFFAPSEMIIADLSNGSSTKTVSVGGENAGNITTSGGTTNIITRFSVDPLSSGTSIYNVKNTGGTTNVVLQGKLDIGTHLDYTKNSAINLIFANNNNNNNGTDSFEASQTELTGNGSKILGVTYQDGVKLAIADKTVMIGDNPSASFLETYSSYYTNGSTALATVLANRTDDKDTISIHGLIVGNIYSLATSTASGVGTGGYAVNGKTYNVTLEKGSAFAGSINLDASTTSAINIVMNEGSKLILADASDNASANNFVISTLKITGGSVDTYQLQTETLKQSNTVINIATGGASANNVAERENFRLLTIGNANTSNRQSNAKAETGLQGEGAAVFMTYVNTNANQENATLGGVSSSGKTSAVVSRSRGGTEGQYGNLYSDRIIIANIGDNTKAQNGTYYMQFAVDANSKLGSVTYDNSNDRSGNGGTKTAGNIAVLTVVNTGSNGSKQAGITLKTQDVLQGFDQIGGDLVAIQTDINGVYDSNGAYTTYFINNLTTRGATQATQEATASAFATNYDLYLANFNSLNKRMGELRENDHSQGVWARVFSGAQSNDFSKSKSTYTTVQGGYDYALGMEGANNYIGLAVAYAMSSSKSNLNALDITGTTKNIENIKSNAVEVAAYNSYVQDEGWYNDSIAKFSYIFSDFNITGQESTYSTNNMAFTLSDEFGYRFKLGSEKEWMIDPQLEVAFGYFNQSDFIQTLGLSSLEGVAEGIFTTRARLGSSFGYDFKKFTQGKGIKASIYVGAFYEYDYVTGGDIRLTTNLGGETTSSSAISSDGRVVMNVGTNVEIYDNTRIYFDFESSFAGKIRTDYQVNIGARYSFGESNGYTPAVAKAKEVAPLKVEEVKNTQENQAQKSKITQESK